MSEEELPEGWAAVALEDLLEPGGLFDGPFGSSLKTSDYTDKGVRVVRLENLGNLSFNEEKRTFISQEKYRELEKHTVCQGDIIFGSFVDGAVRVALMPRLDVPAIAKADCFTVRTDRKVIDRKFLLLQLGTDATRDALIEEIHGATRPRINTKQLRALTVAAPPLAEQRRIVEKVEALLAHVNAARARLAEVPATLKCFRQSILSAACSGRLTEDWRQSQHADVERSSTDPTSSIPADSLFEIPEDWAWRTLDVLRAPDRGIIYGIIKPGPHVEDGVPYVRVVEMKDGRIDVASLRRASPTRAALFKRATLRAGDILISKDGTIGRVAVVPPELEGGNITQHLVRFSPNGDNLTAFLVLAIQAPEVQKWLTGEKKGVALQGVNVEDFRRLPLPIPPLPEQHEIVRRVEALFKLADTIEAHLAAATARADKLTRAILAKAFRGELVPTEAELARQEGRDYEPASALLARVRAAREAGPAPVRPKRAKPTASQPPAKSSSGKRRN